MSVHVGDSVKFRIVGGLIHTATFVPRGQSVPALAMVDPSHPVSGVKDANGAAFWFNGQPRPIINPVAAFPTAGHSVTGGAFVNSGIPSDQAKGTTFRMTFPKKGTFKFVCLVHPGMRGAVKVLPRSAHIPSRAQDAAAAKREIRAIVKVAKAKAKRAVPAGQVDVGRTGPALTINSMFPTSITVKAGHAVTFSMAGQSRLEIHTVSLGPESVTGPIETSFITPTPNATGPPTLVINPLAAFPSDPPPTLPPYTGTNHGNGFLNSGVLDNDPATPQQPNSAAITFSTPGTYHFQCVIHPNMDGTVVVTP
ncbi:MAG: cupredoxin domain-containing protein [Solirubrobacteraceae bacterium]